MTPTPSPDPARYVSPVCRDGSHQACANFRGTCRCTCHAAAVEGTERPGGWRKKPVEVEARQVHYANRFDVAAWCGGEAQDAAPSGNVYAPGLLSINTLEGKMWASEGDWIIRGVKGEFYPCKPDIFAATYEPATPQPPVPPSPAPQADGLIGWMVFIADGHGGWDADWDGLIYTDRPDADRELEAASVDWGAVLAEVRRVTDRSDAAAPSAPVERPDPDGLSAAELLADLKDRTERGMVELEKLAAPLEHARRNR